VTPDLLVAGADRAPLPWTWRRSLTTDLLAGSVAVALVMAGLAVHARPAGRGVKTVAAPAYGSRPNLDLPTGANLHAAVVDRALRYDRTPSADGLGAAVGNAVFVLCGGADVDAVVSREVTGNFAGATLVVRARIDGVPMKERPQTGTVALRLMFRRDGYDVAAERRSGACLAVAP
jgi:hypothetical protein